MGWVKTSRQRWSRSQITQRQKRCFINVQSPLRRYGFFMMLLVKGELNDVVISFSRLSLQRKNASRRKFGVKLHCSYLDTTSKPCYSFHMQFPASQANSCFATLICTSALSKKRSRATTGQLLAWNSRGARIHETHSAVQTY